MLRRVGLIWSMEGDGLCGVRWRGPTSCQVCGRSVTSLVYVTLALAVALTLPAFPTPKSRL